MSRLIIVFAIAFVTALAGGAGSATIKAKKVAAVMLDSLRKVEADSLTQVAKTDSLKAKRAAAAEGEHGAVAGGVDSVLGNNPKADGKAEGAKVTAAVDAKGEHGVAAKGATTAVAVGAAKPVKDELLPSGVIGERLGKIFTAMPSKDAVKVMEKLDDDDIALILSKINDKKAAEVLALMPPDRAAAISKSGIAHVTHLAKADKP